MTEQLTLFNFPATETIKPLYDPYWDEIVKEQVSTTTISPPVEPLVGGQVTSVTNKLAHQHDDHWIEKYWVERSSNKYWYYRYTWREAGKKNRFYIGSVDSPKARAKKVAVEFAIADGQTPQEIKQMLQGWKNE
ncbi:hypothetical protein NOS3756_27330 [Nostoc sp. NIES-3756]|uniref:hypothetical protein n=1 Tax=Nostoc sp. NIES-3756 TaxID=1751286 RepID=UPI00071FFC34|nr:hypothetical protein [Nostoc sp. NIES-3756]BAT53770.1 hypothetical protein NOS3756_27330 [Nostoc sp. NIES-3756]